MKSPNTDIKNVHPFDDRARFVAALGEKLKTAEQKAVLIYVHGFNNTFNQAVEAASFLAADMKFRGVTIVFSWPSEGFAPLYGADEKEVRNSRKGFVEFLQAVRDATGAYPVNLIAHSMGGRLITDGLEWIAGQGNLKKPILHHLIFAAPDVDAWLFTDVIPSFVKSAERVTLYASSYDQALLCSETIHHGTRAGQADPLVVKQNIETIDVTKAEPRSALAKVAALDRWLDRAYWLLLESCREGHSYITKNDRVLVDLYSLVIFNATPDQRRDLDERPWQQLHYWEFR